MSPIVGLRLIMGLAIGLFILRRAAVARRNKRLQRQAARSRAPPPRTTSERGEMRAYEDPSTLARDITTTGPSSEEPSSGKKR